jgi:hypothetical protein
MVTQTGEPQLITLYRKKNLGGYFQVPAHQPSSPYDAAKGFPRKSRKLLSDEVPLESRCCLKVCASNRGQPIDGSLNSGYCIFAYSALACFSMGMSGSASFQRAKKSW